MLKKDKDRFFSKFNKGEGCWIWVASKSWRGYGFFYCQGKHYRAHRVSYTLHVGEIPKGMYVCHKCDTPECVNPDHLFLGTNMDNVNDMMRKGRMVISKGEEHGNSKLTESDVLEARRLYKSGVMSQASLAKKHGVSPQAMHLAVSGKRWKHLKETVGNE